MGHTGATVGTHCGIHWGHCGAHTGTHWGHCGTHWGHCGAHWGHCGAYIVGHTGATLRHVVGHTEAHTVGHIGACLGKLWLLTNPLTTRNFPTDRSFKQLSLPSLLRLKQLMRSLQHTHFSSRADWGCKSNHSHQPLSHSQNLLRQASMGHD